LNRVAKETGSEALAADALHFSSDLINSVMVLLAFGAAALGYPEADALVALGVSVFIAIAGYRLARRTLDTLLDAAPAGMTLTIRELLNDVPGVVAIDDLRLRRAGTDLFVEVAIAVARTMPLDRLTHVKEMISAKINNVFDDARVTVSATPRALDEETILERVLLIAAKRRVPVHHVTVQNLADRLSVSLDLEVDGHLTLGEAHSIASQLEFAIQEELGPTTEVETHIEPLVVSSLTGKDSDEVTRTHIADALVRHAAAIGEITDIHSVRVRETGHGLIVNYHCRVAPERDVTSVHELVDRLEHDLKSEIKNILRIVSHTEPVRPANS
jgi:divalent metal cation (Fe/Co/Zn/Cd) transporter